MSGSSSIIISSWVARFCKQRGKEFFCEVDTEFMKDSFNVQGLREQLPMYWRALAMILDESVEPNEDDTTKLERMVESSAEVLYGLIHARFILTPQGMARMIKKLFARDFGRCPRVYCNAQFVLPVGISDVRGLAAVKIYCPNCLDVYTPASPRHHNVDGAYFGTGFPHMLFMMFPMLRPVRTTEQYVPRLYGFKVHPEAYKKQNADSANGSENHQKQNANGSENPPHNTPNGNSS